jgi:hypothetical protein
MPCRGCQSRPPATAVVVMTRHLLECIGEGQCSYMHTRCGLQLAILVEGLRPLAGLSVPDRRTTMSLADATHSGSRMTTPIPIPRLPPERPHVRIHGCGHHRSCALHHRIARERPCSQEHPHLGHVHYRDGRDSRFADAGGIAERVAFCRYN